VSIVAQQIKSLSLVGRSTITIKDHSARTRDLTHPLLQFGQGNRPRPWEALLFEVCGRTQVDKSKLFPSVKKPFDLFHGDQINVVIPAMATLDARHPASKNQSCKEVRRKDMPTHRNHGFFLTARDF